MKKNYTLGNKIHFNLIKCSISSAEQEVMLGGREAKLLELFCENPNKVLDKTYIMNAVWENVIVSDTSLTKAISNLRKSLARFTDLICKIKTIPKEGYIFIFEIRSENWNVEDNILKVKDTAYQNIQQEKLGGNIVRIDNGEKVTKAISLNRRRLSLLLIIASASLISSVSTAFTLVMILGII